MPRELPNVLTEEEVSRIIKATTNLKHKIILMLNYSAGLRLSELMQMRLAKIQNGAIEYL